MFSRLALGGLTLAVGFLLVTNPVVVEAAGQIGSGQIKNNSIKSKDIKNGSVTSADLAAGTVPSVSIRAFKRFLGGSDGHAIPTSVGFYGNTTTVGVDGNDVLFASGSLDYYAQVAGDDLYYSICSRPAGSSAVPAPIGGADAASPDIDGADGDGTVSRHVSAVLAAGNYDIGMCVRADSNNSGNIISYGQPGGWVMVLDGVASFG